MSRTERGPAQALWAPVASTNPAVLRDANTIIRLANSAIVRKADHPINSIRSLVTNQAIPNFPANLNAVMGLNGE